MQTYDIYEILFKDCEIHGRWIRGSGIKSRKKSFSLIVHILETKDLKTLMVTRVS